MENKKYYTRSNGEQILLSEVEFTHLSNGLAKKYRELFEAVDKDDFSTKLKDINDIKEVIEEINSELNTEEGGDSNDE
jgi:flagellin-specific chaperone FliS